MVFLKFLVVTIVLLHTVSAMSPTLKQGGAACNSYTNYCMNGGTCYTQYTTQPASLTTHQTTTTTTQKPTTTQYIIVTQPVCGCQPQFFGDRCEQQVHVETVAPSRCSSVQCLNGGECRETGIAPYVICL